MTSIFLMHGVLHMQVLPNKRLKLYLATFHALDNEMPEITNPS